MPQYLENRFFLGLTPNYSLDSYFGNVLRRLDYSHSCHLLEWGTTKITGKCCYACSVQLLECSGWLLGGFFAPNQISLESNSTPLLSKLHNYIPHLIRYIYIIYILIAEFCHCIIQEFICRFHSHFKGICRLSLWWFSGWHDVRFRSGGWLNAKKICGLYTINLFMLSFKA